MHIGAYPSSQTLILCTILPWTSGYCALLGSPGCITILPRFFPARRFGFPMLLTDSNIARIVVPTNRSEVVVFDDKIAGFGIRVRKGGSRRFVYQYKLGKQHRKVTFKESSAARARETAERLQAKVTLGQDVAAAKAQAKDAAGDTFKRCLALYLALPQGKRRDSTISERKRHLEQNLKPLHPLHIKTIDRRRVAQELARLSQRAPVQANRTRASLSKFLNWCVGEGYLDFNIALATNRNEEISRERVLSDDELRIVWNSLPTDDYGEIIRLLILTGQRLREISNLRWDEINLTKATIALPASRTKNHREHVIPLSRPALAILKTRATKRDDDRDLVFGSGEKGYSGFSKSKDRLDAAAEIKDPWTIHDLRRTFSTGAGKLGVAPHVIEATLNHISGPARGGTLGAIYNKSTYEEEKRAALALWGKHVLAVVSKGKRLPQRSSP